MDVSVVFVLFLVYIDVHGAPGDKPSSIRSTVTSSVWTPGGSWSGGKKKEERIVFPDFPVRFPDRFPVKNVNFGPVSEKEEEIVFPDFPERFPDRFPVKNVNLPPHPCPDNRTKCVENYPSNYIQQLPEKIMSRFLPFFTNDSLQPNGESEPSSISTRIDPAGEYALCESREYIDFPKDAKTTKGDTKIIVNSGHYLQGLRYELCVNPGNACALSNSLPDGYKTTCRQKYINRKLVYLTLGEKQEPVATDDFLIPSCCVCKYVYRNKYDGLD